MFYIMILIDSEHVGTEARIKVKSILQGLLINTNRTEVVNVMKVCVCVFQCLPTALLRASGSTQGG